jgi:hypothetical protein
MRCSPKILLLVSIATISACRRTAPLPDSPSNDYTDLRPGQTLSVTVPYLASGGYTLKPGSAQVRGSTITLAAGQSFGYQVTRFQVNSAANGQVHLRFKATATSRGGETTHSTHLPALPFPLPRKRAYIRLIYFTRNSQADHNMAIVASQNATDLNALTQRIKITPEACQTDRAISCVWVPPGIAVRQE